MNRIDRLVEITSKRSRKVIGLMSGTSLDAIDVVITEIEGHAADSAVEQIAFESFPFPPALRASIFEQLEPSSSSVDEICHLDFLLGEVFAEAVLETLRRSSLDTSEIDLIGTAGQTVWHDPSSLNRTIEVDWLSHPITTRSTLAIGQSSVIAERTGIMTLGDLRVRDVAAGGHGAPLVAYADWVLLRSPDRNRCIQNIGGIANVTWLPAGGGVSEVIAFDTGPGNMIIDALVEIATGGEQTLDVDGRIASRGTVQDAPLRSWLEDPYYGESPPKTTGRERFGKQYARELIERSPDLSDEDRIATATALTARSIADAYHRFVRPHGSIDEVIICGGGAGNQTLLQMIERELPGSHLLSPEEIGLDHRSKEALSIAIIANDSLAGLPTNVPGATGGRSAILGKLSL